MRSTQVINRKHVLKVSFLIIKIKLTPCLTYSSDYRRKNKIGLHKSNKTTCI